MTCDVNCKFYPMCWNVGEGICEVGEDCDRYEPERPHGEWIYKGGKYWCSSCGEKAIYHSHVKEPLPHLTNFCPNCGASMVSSNSEIEKSKSETREGEAK